MFFSPANCNLLLQHLVVTCRRQLCLLSCNWCTRHAWVNGKGNSIYWLSSHTVMSRISHLWKETLRTSQGLTLRHDIIFCNFVIHWIPDKQELFNNMFEGLKHGGKIAIQYVGYICPFVSRAYKELNPENAERIFKMYHYEERPKIEQYCSTAGFRITKSYDTHSTQQVFQTIDSLLNWLWSSTHGAFDPKLVTEERLQRYYPYSSRDGKPSFDFRGIKEESGVCRLVAVRLAGPER